MFGSSSGSIVGRRRGRAIATWLRRRLLRGTSLRLRIVLLVVIALLPTFVLFLVHTRQEQQSLLGEAENRALLIARAWNEHNSEYLDEANVLLRLVNDIKPDDPECRQKLATIVSQTHWRSEVAIVDRTTNVLCSSAAESAVAGRLDASFVADLFESRQLTISDFKIGESGQSLAFAGLRLLKGSDGVERAAVTSIDLAEIQRRTEPVAQGMQYGVMVVGRDGIVLAQHPESNALLGRRLPSDDPLMPDLNTQIEGVAMGSDADGVPQIYAYSQLPQLGAKVVIGLPRAAALGAADAAVRRVIVALIVVTLLAAAGAWLTAEMSVLRWVSVLTEAAVAFGRRDLAHRALVPKRAGEFATLAKAFNGMAALLSNRQQELERRVAERTAALTAMQAELVKQERYSAVGQLAASVAHELRNPLGAAKNTVHTIQEIAKERQVDMARPIRRIERSLARCEQTIANLVDYVYAGELKRHNTRFDRWLAEYLEAQPLPAGIALARDLGAPSAVISLDNTRLALAIGNILDNAVQAILEQDSVLPEGTIIVSTRAAEHLTLVIEDTGPGMAADTLPRIFDSLFTTRSFGLGLGLPTARKIVEQHAGTIVAESTAGQGTRITIALPIHEVRELERETSAAA